MTTNVNRGLDREAVNWGFVGASTWASRYLVPAVEAVSDARAVGIFSSSRERGERFAAANGLEVIYDSFADLLEDGAIDAVYIGTTNERHAEQAIAAARAGKHVLCEKPLALSCEEGRRMLAECARAEVVLATDHHLRGAPTIIAMRESIEAAAIGEIVAARVFHAVSLPEELRTWRLDRPEAGAGAILDLTVHDVDTIRFLLDDEVVEVTAMSSNQGLAKPPVEDSAMTVLRMERGVLVSLHDAFTVPHAGSGIEIHGTHGSLLGRGVIAPEPVGEVILRRGETEEEIDVPERWPLYERVIERFDDAVRSGGAPLASGEDGLASLAVALAAAESARAGRSVSLEN